MNIREFNLLFMNLKIGNSVNPDDQHYLDILKKYRSVCKFFKIKHLPDEFWMNFFYLAKRNKMNQLCKYLDIASSTKHYKVKIKEKYPCDSFVEMPDQEKFIRYNEKNSEIKLSKEKNSEIKLSKFIPMEFQEIQPYKNDDVVISVTTKNGSTIEIKNIKNPIEFLKELL